MAFESFDQAIQYMNSFMNLERSTDRYSEKTYRLDRVRKMLEMLGNPQNSYRTIHVAGSKGKGSTAAFVANAIQALGYKTGLYMSPHVSDYRERFTLCGSFVEDSVLIRTADEMKAGISDIEDPTTFELYTVFAFLLFKNCGCDWAVIETGMGGRLDATNVILPQACILTPVELEHTKILGDTIEKIAIEKSKIIKHKVPVFVSFQKDEAMKVFKAEASDCNSSIYTLEDELEKITTRCTGKGQLASLQYKDGFKAEMCLEMPGDAQACNAALALLVIRKLGLYSKGVTEKALEHTKLPGRMEKIPYKGRYFYIDGAHTVNSIDLLMRSWKELGNDRKGICIFGCVEGKKDSQMLTEILPCFRKLVISRPGTFKKSNPSALYDTAKTVSEDTEVVLREEARDAVEYALENSEEGELILVCGSFYLAGDIKEVLCH